MKKQIYRNGLKFINEAEFNEWAINETELWIENDEKYYNEFNFRLKNKTPKSCRQFIKYVMISQNIKIKNKNVLEVYNYLKGERIDEING